MRAVVQRVTSARVRVGDRVVGAIERGLLVLVGVARNDGPEDVAYVTAKIRDMRVFDGEDGRPNHRSVMDIQGSVLLVSQFTLFADTRRGRRPGFTGAAAPDLAERLYLRFADALRGLGVTVATGRFGAEMTVDLVNDGPFTIWLDSDEH